MRDQLHKSGCTPEDSASNSFETEWIKRFIGNNFVAGCDFLKIDGDGRAVGIFLKHKMNGKL